MNKIATVKLISLVGALMAASQSALAAVPAGVETSVSGGAADIVTVIGYMITGALTVWAVKKMLRLFGW